MFFKRTRPYLPSVNESSRSLFTLRLGNFSSVVQFFSAAFPPLAVVWPLAATVDVNAIIQVGVRWADSAPFSVVRVPLKRLFILFHTSNVHFFWVRPTFVPPAFIQIAPPSLSLFHYLYNLNFHSSPSSLLLIPLLSSLVFIPLSLFHQPVVSVANN